MTRPVPAAAHTLRILKLLAAQPGPVPADRIAGNLGLPRSSTYHLLRAMSAEGFVVHYADDRRWGLGVAAFEVGSGYARHQPLQRLARIPLARLVDRIGQSAHLAVLHGREVYYVLEERAPGKPSLVTDVGVRLPAHLTASGRAILATLADAQVRALFPDSSAFVDRHDAGPRTISALRQVLVQTRRDGYATEDGEVTRGFGSVAVAVPGIGTADPAPASIAITYESERSAIVIAEVVAAAHATAELVGRRFRPNP